MTTAPRHRRPAPSLPALPEPPVPVDPAETRALARRGLAPHELAELEGLDLGPRDSAAPDLRGVRVRAADDLDLDAAGPGAALGRTRRAGRYGPRVAGSGTGRPSLPTTRNGRLAAGAVVLAVATASAVTVPVLLGGSDDAVTSTARATRSDTTTSDPSSASPSTSTTSAMATTPAPSMLVAPPPEPAPTTESRSPSPSRTATRSATPTPTSSTTTAEPPAAPAPAPPPPPPPAPSPSATGTASAEVLAAEAEVLRLVNVARAEVGCPALTADGPLTTLARDFSADMAARGFFSHTDPDGKTPWDRAAARGIGNLRAENIARGQSTPDAVMRSWLDSPGHRKNIENCDYRTLGVGVHIAGGGPWWTQNFGA